MLATPSARERVSGTFRIVITSGPAMTVDSRPPVERLDNCCAPEVAARIIEKFPEAGDSSQPNAAALWVVEGLYAKKGEPVSADVVADVTATWTGRDGKQVTNLVTAVTESSTEYLP